MRSKQIYLGSEAVYIWDLKLALQPSPFIGIPMPTEKDATHYNMSHRRRGKAYIFNHMHFDPVQQLKARNGTDADRDNLRVCLRQLDFEVEVFNDLPVKDIDRVLENAALEDHSDADCVLVAGLKIWQFQWCSKN